MKQLLAIKFPGANGTPQEIQVSGIPQGGLSGDGGKFISFGLMIFLDIRFHIFWKMNCTENFAFLHQF